MVDSRTLRREGLNRTPTTAICIEGPFDFITLKAATATIKPGRAVAGASATQCTDADTAHIMLGIADVDLTGSSACKTIGGTYASGDSIQIATKGKVRAALETGAGDPVHAGHGLIVGGTAGLMATEAATSTATAYGCVARLMEEYATADAITNVLVKLL